MTPEQIQVGSKVRCEYPDPSCFGWTGKIVCTRHVLGKLIEFWIDWDPGQENLDYRRDYNLHWLDSGSQYFVEIR